MRRGLVPLVLFALLVGSNAEAGRLKKMEPAEQDAYQALRVYMSADEEKAWMKGKTRADRDAWLKSHGTPKSYWERWNAYDPDMQAQILAGKVAIGWDQEAVFMAWGEPADRFRIPGRPATWSEMFVYKFEETPNGDVLLWAPGSNQTYKAVKMWQTRLTIDDQRVTEIEDKDGWE